MSSTRIAPMIDPMIPAGLTATTPPKIRLARKPPTNDPMMPSTMVPIQPIGSGPGTRNRATAPAMRPTMMKPRIAPMSMSTVLSCAKNPSGRALYVPVAGLASAGVRPPEDRRDAHRARERQPEQDAGGNEALACGAGGRSARVDHHAREGRRRIASDRDDVARGR